PERHFRFGSLLQRQGKADDAQQAYTTALEAFRKSGNTAGIFDVLDRLAGLEPDNVERQIELGEQGTRMGKTDLAAKAFLRAGQLLRADNLDRAIEFLERAFELAPERSTALSLAQTRLDKGKAHEAADLLLNYYAEGEQDPAVLETLAAALMADKRLPQAQEVLEAFYNLKPDSYDKLFDLADLYCKTGTAERGVEVLRRVKEKLFAAERQRHFLTRLEDVFKANSSVIPLAEFSAALFNELNQDARYGMVLASLFDLYAQAEDHKGAADTLERLIDIDPYDFNHQKRIEKLRGKVDNARYRSIASRITSAATVPGQAPASASGEEQVSDISTLDPGRRQALLEDMIVQVEIFLQYALRAKAVEKLEQVYKLFPGEEGRNERLHRLYDLAQYSPPGLKGPPPPGGAPYGGAPAHAAAPPPPPPPPAASPMESVSDLAKISEITHALYRQTTPKTVLHTAVSELGKHLRTSRCLGILGKIGKPPSTAVEFCSPGVPQSPGTAVMKLLGVLGQANPDPETGVVLDISLSPELAQVGAQAVLAMPLMSKETHEDEGLIALSQSDRPRQWKPNEVYLLKAVADQVVTAISNIKLRTLMKRLSVSDDASGLLPRSSYLDVLVNEAKRAKSQGTPLVVALLELDKGTHLVRQLGDASFSTFMQQVGEAVLANVRQTDITVRYTSTSVAVVLGDTTIDKARPVVDKLRAKLGALTLPGGKVSVSFSAGLSEAAVRPDYDPADIVTDVINRAEFSLEEARLKGNTVAVR
ncbi:MAG: diguanylate cyclase domain-containing protein, partial [Candidatus Acidiferrales bacterium]